MIEYNARENDFLELVDVSKSALNDLLEIGAQIKDKLGLNTSPIQYVSESKVYIGSIIGNLSLNDTRLVIRPKFSEGNAETDMVKKLLERTIKCSVGNLDSTVYFTGSATVSSDELFADALATLFISLLTTALRGNKIMQYEEIIAKSKVIKGRILMAKQLSQPVTDEKAWCKFNRMSDKNICNQLLYWACKYLSEAVRNFSLKKRLLLLSREFAPQTELLSVRAVKSLKLSRQYADYSEILSISKSLYLGSGGVRQTGNIGKQICGYVINMERAFENIVCRYADTAATKLGFSHKGQASIRFATANGNYDYDYVIRPDDLISDGRRYLVMDAKYKTLTTNSKSKRKPSREDFYQMISSCIAYRCPEAILIYPLTSNFPSQAWNTLQDVNGRQISIQAVGVDILGSDKEIEDTLTSAIRASYIYKEKAI